jgi:hypothetical protein
VEAWYLDGNGKRVDVRHAAWGESPGALAHHTAGSVAVFAGFCTARRDIPNLVFWEREEQRQISGFPFRSMYREDSSITWRDPGGSLQSTYAQKHTIEIDRKLAKNLGYPWDAPGRGDFRFPAGLLWLGFIGDAFIWTFAWSGLIFGPGVLRHWRRWRRGLCLACGYDLAGNVNGTCPECGSPIPDGVRRRIRDPAQSV